MKCIATEQRSEIVLAQSRAGGALRASPFRLIVRSVRSTPTTVRPVWAHNSAPDAPWCQTECEGGTTYEVLELGVRNPDGGTRKGVTRTVAAMWAITEVLFSVAIRVKLGQAVVGDDLSLPQVGT